MVGSVIDTHFPSVGDIGRNTTFSALNLTEIGTDIELEEHDPHIQEKIDLASSLSFFSGFIMVLLLNMDKTCQCSIT